MLTQQHLKEIIHYDSETGEMTWLVHVGSNQATIGSRVGSYNNVGYRRTRIHGKDYLIHRLAWFYVYGEWPIKLIDHINGIRDDNRIANLRQANHRQNLSNVHKPTSRNKTGFLGVSYCERDKSYRAYIGVDMKRIALGSYKTAEEASEAYLAAKKIHHSFAYES